MTDINLPAVITATPAISNPPGYDFLVKAGIEQQTAMLARMLLVELGSEQSANRYATDIRILQRWCAQADVRMMDLERHDANEFRRWLRENYKYRSVKRILSVCRRLYGHAVAAKRIEANPFSDMSRMRGESADPPPAFTLEEQRSLISTIERDQSARGIRDLALIYLLLTSGPRRESVRLLNWGDLGVERGYDLVTIRAKGGVEGKKLRIKHRARELLDAWAGALEAFIGPGALVDDAPVFVEFNRSGPTGKRLSPNGVLYVVRRRLEEAGLYRPGAVVHIMRATMITTALDSGVDITRVQDQAGHKSVLTTGGYARRADALANPTVDAIPL